MAPFHTEILLASSKIGPMKQGSHQKHKTFSSDVSRDWNRFKIAWKDPRGKMNGLAKGIRTSGTCGYLVTINCGSKTTNIEEVDTTAR